LPASEAPMRSSPLGSPGQALDTATTSPHALECEQSCLGRQGLRNMRLALFLPLTRLCLPCHFHSGRIRSPHGNKRPPTG